MRVDDVGHLLVTEFGGQVVFEPVFGSVDKGVVDGGVYEDMVRCQADLSSVEELVGHDSFGCKIDIGCCGDNTGALAAKLEDYAQEF